MKRYDFQDALAQLKRERLVGGAESANTGQGGRRHAGIGVDEHEIGGDGTENVGNVCGVDGGREASAVKNNDGIVIAVSQRRYRQVGTCGRLSDLKIGGDFVHGR